jgi:hypothetical protein
MTTNRTMYLYHVTKESNLFSIDLLGLEPGFSAGALLSTWLVTGGKITWAIEHVAKRHGVPVTSLYVIRVRVRRSELYRTRVRGAWSAPRTIDPCRIEQYEPAAGYIE